MRNKINAGDFCRRHGIAGVDMGSRASSPWDRGRPRHGIAGVLAGVTWGSGRPVRGLINKRGQSPLQL